MTRKGWLLFAVISVFWGIPYLFIKIAVREIDPAVVVVARVAIAAVILTPIALKRGTLRQIRSHWLAVGALALVQVAIPFLLISYGEQHISSSLASLLIAGEPLLVAVLAIRLDPSERVSGFRFAGQLIGLAGVMLLVGLDAGGDKFKLLGAGLVLLATVGYALGALLVRRRPFVALPSLGIIAMQCLISTLVLAPLALARRPAYVPSASVLGSLIVLGVVCTALGWLVFFALVAEVGASRGTVFTYVNPAVAVVLGVTLLGEPLNAAMIAGFLLIILGSWLSTGGRIPPRFIALFGVPGAQPVVRDEEITP